MSKSNPFKTAGETEESRDKESRKAPKTEEQKPEGEDVSELNEELRELREEVKRLHGVMEPEPPEPDYECEGGACEGFAVEEIEPDHIDTESGVLSTSGRTKTVECPRCGEEMGVEEFVPKKEQEPVVGNKPLRSNPKAAARGLKQRFKEKGREDVLERAEKQSGK